MAESKERYGVTIGGITITDANRGGAPIAQFGPCGHYMGWTREQLLVFEEWLGTPAVTDLINRFNVDMSLLLFGLGADYARTKADFDAKGFDKLRASLRANPTSHGNQSAFVSRE